MIIYHRKLVDLMGYRGIDIRALSKETGLSMRRIDGMRLSDVDVQRWELMRLADALDVPSQYFTTNYGMNLERIGETIILSSKRAKRRWHD